MARQKFDPDKEMKDRNKKFYKHLSETCKSYNEYKNELIANNAKFIEISFGNCNICIPEDKFKEMSQVKKNKIFNYFKEA